MRVEGLVGEEEGRGCIIARDRERERVQFRAFPWLWKGWWRRHPAYSTVCPGIHGQKRASIASLLFAKSVDTFCDGHLFRAGYQRWNVPLEHVRCFVVRAFEMERLFIARHFFNDKSNNVKKNFEENWNISEDLKKKIRSLRYLLSTIATIVDILIHVFIRKI